ncbi:sensor histidine kinase [Pseudonocardia sp. MH-G8]|uniref:sensor histidine kinase n=1 Tax=Pseudonocardia sp. MH-G8 TaxID=1854588 RepID=UPI00350F5598
MLDRSRVVAAHLLDPPRHSAPKVLEAAPSAWGEAARNESLGEVCASIALRDLNLIDTLLAELEELERKEDDSTRLGQLYRLDHLAARLRRNAENLRVLAGRDAGESGGDTTSVLDTIRGAMSSIDQYARIGIGRTVPLGVVGFAADDLSRVLAELLDNAANHSPPDEQVRVSAHLTEQGSVLIRIEDGGIGLPPDRLADLNSRLAQGLRLDDDAVRHMGLAVVGRLAERHDLQVALHRKVPNGTTATVLVPPSLVTELPEERWSGAQTVPVNGRHQPHPVAAPRDGVPVPSSDGPSDTAVTPATDAAPTVTPSGLPRRGARPPAPPPPTPPSPTPRPAAPTVSGATASGLPRRVSRSTKDAAVEVDDPGGGGEPVDDGHDKFLADLGDFADGEQAARAEDTATDSRVDERADTDEEPK